jgi:hypothetical protein
MELSGEQVVGVLILLIVAGLLVFGMRRQLRTLRLRARGEAAYAEVLRQWNTEWAQDDDPKIGLDLRVMPKEAPPFHAQMTFYVSGPSGAAAFRPGTIIAVRFEQGKDKPLVVLDGPLPRRETPVGLAVIFLIVLIVVLATTIASRFANAVP